MFPSGRMQAVQRVPARPRAAHSLLGETYTCPQVVELWVCSLNQSLPNHEGASLAGDDKGKCPESSSIHATDSCTRRGRRLVIKWTPSSGQR